MRIFSLNIGPLIIAFDWHPPVSYTMRLGEIQFTFPKGIVLKMATTLPDDKVLPFIAPTTGVDSKGNPTTLKGGVKATSSDVTIATIVQPNPKTPDVAASGVVVPVGPLGNVQIKFEDDDEGGSPLIALADVSIVAGSTVGLGQPVFGPVEDAFVPPSA